MKNRFVRGGTGLLALLSLAMCLAAPVLYFLGRITEGSYKAIFLAASIGGVVFAIARGAAGKGPAAG